MNVKCKATKVNQPLGEFFIAKISASDLVKISKRDVRKLNDESEIETYLGIQRPLNKVRARDIQKYVKYYDASFPTSIILSVPESGFNWDEREECLEFMMSDDTSLARILDGQHRVAGFMDLETYEPLEEQCFFTRVEEGPNGKFEEVKYPFELVITVLVGLDLPEQANIFATVNLKQTKVSKSLAYDLEAYTKTRSPQKVSHEIVIALDQAVKSPFRGRVKRLGFKEGKLETLSQSTLVEEILCLISENPLEDRDILLRAEKLSTKQKWFSNKKIELDPLLDNKNLVFRKFFIAENDDGISKRILYFFMAVQKRWPAQWEAGNKKSVLNKTVGVKALFRILRDIIKKKAPEEQTISLEYFLGIFEKVDLEGPYFETLDATSSTVNKIYSELHSKIF